MSVILDALRRARGGAAAPPARPGRPASAAMSGGLRPVPAGLRIGKASRGRNDGPRTIVLGGALVAVVVLGVYGTVQVSRRFLASRPRAAVVSRAPAAPRPATPPPAAASDAANARQQELQKAVAESLGITLPKQQGQELPPPSRALKPTGRPAPTPPAPAAVAPRAAATPAPPRPVPVRSTVPARPTPAVTTAATTAVPAVPQVNHFDLAVRYQSLGDFEQALKHYLAVLDADEFNVEARNNLGLLYHDRGLVNESVEQFRKAISIDPKYLKARSNLAVVLMDAGRLAEARAELRAALAIDPRNVDLLVNMALVEKADHQPDAAAETLLRAIGIQPTHALAHYNLALIYEERGETGHAYDHYTAFLQNAGPEQGALLSDVRRRLDTLRAQLDTARTR